MSESIQQTETTESSAALEYYRRRFAPLNFWQKIQEREHELIEEALRQSKGNLQAASKLLGLGDTGAPSLYRRIQTRHLDLLDLCNTRGGHPRRGNGATPNG